jgi:hypothetical protein
MNIQYLKKLEAYKGNSVFKRQGFKVEEIIALEVEFNNGNSLPASVREYLFLAGETNALEMDIGNGWKWMQEEAKSLLEYYDSKIEKPFFVLYQIDGCMIFTFIYLDEITDNPEVYICYPDYKYDDMLDEFITPINQKYFVELVEAKIVAAVSDDKYLGSNEK